MSGSSFRKRLCNVGVNSFTCKLSALLAAQWKISIFKQRCIASSPVRPMMIVQKGAVGGNPPLSI